MNEKLIFKISLILTISGLIFLFFYAENLPETINNNLESQQNEQTIKIEGNIDQIRVTEKAVFLEVAGQRTETMQIIFFPNEEPFLKAGDHVEVTGKVEEYLGKKEVIADQVVIK
ncbi:MAG: OB-fold nucleic acid binding domain-containing protein [Candidatus Woesearchaeota archaeon]